MTKEEAIKIIKSECYVFNPLNFDRTQMVNTALDMAIRSLEAGTRSDQPITKYDLRINFNDKIKVKLTDLGKDIFYHQYDLILEQNPKTRAYIQPHYPKVDEEGYTTFLLWQFMQLYGKHIGMGAPNVILPLEIIKCESEAQDENACL